MDNASIHKSIHIKRLVNDKKARILTIHPYEPSLNPTEKLILAIKSKIKTRQFQGQVISFALIKAVVDEVALVRLKGMVDASFKEAVSKARQICQQFLLVSKLIHIFIGIISLALLS